MVDEEVTIRWIPIEKFERETRQLLDGAVKIFAQIAYQFEKRDRANKQDYLAVLRDPSRTLRGSELEQKPEVFTEQFLVHPLLELLGFNYVREPKMVFESISEKDIGSFADFRITDVSYTRKDQLIGLPGGDKEFVNTYKPNVFGESKPLNHHRKAKKEIQERYTGPYMDIDVGIATDGLDWGVYIDIPRAETWDKFSLRQFALKVTAHVYEAPTLQDSYPDADDQVLSFLRFFYKPNFEHFLLQRDVGVMWE